MAQFALWGVCLHSFLHCLENFSNLFRIDSQSSWIPSAPLLCRWLLERHGQRYQGYSQIFCDVQRWHPRRRSTSQLPSMQSHQYPWSFRLGVSLRERCHWCAVSINVHSDSGWFFFSLQISWQRLQGERHQFGLISFLELSHVDLFYSV